MSAHGYAADTLVFVSLAGACRTLRRVTDTLTIERLSHDGRGIAYRDGKVSFVAGALAGETVDARCVKQGSRHNDYEVVRVAQAAPCRVAPPCPHVAACGGCDLMHFEPAAQIAHKASALVELLARQARIEPRSLEEAIVSTPFGYRRRARLAVLAPRGGTPVVGFRSAGKADVVGIDQCMVLAPALAPLPARINALLGTLAAPRAVGHVEVALSESATGDVNPVVGVRVVGTADAADLERWCEWARVERCYFATEDDAGKVVIHYSPRDCAPGYLLPQFNVRLEYLPGDFLQANAAVNRALVSRVVEWLGLGAGTMVLDAFCGLGNFSLALARAGVAVFGAEVSSAMIARAKHNASSNQLSAEFAVRNLQDDVLVLPKGKFDGVVLDPPRTGAAALAGWIAKQRIARVVYVSCAPGTFVRDAKLLASAGYRLDRLAAVDMFPQTSHSESIALFTRK